MNNLDVSTKKESYISEDDNTRYEAALLFSNSDSRNAISTLIRRINDTNGHCDPKIWLMLLDIYRIQGQQPPYEKLAVFFSNRFSFSPPAWEIFENPNIAKSKSDGQWRNALIIEGSPSTISQDKIKDFIRASKEMKESRIDFSRLRLNGEPQGKQEKDDLDINLDIMRKLRKIGHPTLMMGEAELMDLLRDRIKKSTGDFNNYKTYWLSYLEFLQWRGKSEEFDKIASEFTDKYLYCPVGYENDGAIAVSPTTDEYDHITSEGYEPNEVMDDVDNLLEYAESKWRDNKPAEINMKYVKRVTAEAAREIASFLQAKNQAEEKEKEDTVFLNTAEVVSALFELTGAEAYSVVQHQNDKLRNVLETNKNK